MLKGPKSVLLNTKGERREQKRRKQRKMRLVGKSVQVLLESIKKKANDIRKR